MTATAAIIFLALSLFDAARLCALTWYHLGAWCCLGHQFLQHQKLVCLIGKGLVMTPRGLALLLPSRFISCHDVTVVRMGLAEAKSKC